MDSITKERIVAKIEEIQGYFSDLTEISENDPNIEKKVTYHAISMLLQSIINGSIDLADDIVFLNKLGRASKYKDLFDILYKNRLIDKEVLEVMIFLVQNRNVFAHEYGTLSKELIEEVLDKIDSVYELITLAKNYI